MKLLDFKSRAGVLNLFWSPGLFFYSQFSCDFCIIRGVMLANFTDDSSFVQKKKRIVTKNKLGKKNCGHVVGESRQIRSNQGSPTCGD